MKGKVDKNINVEENYFPDTFWGDIKTLTKENLKSVKLDPKKDYIITAKFKKKGSEVEAFLPRLANAFIKWIEENHGRYT